MEKLNAKEFVNAFSGECKTEKQATEYLNNNYICCCPYGTSPTKCGDDKCEFGQAIRALLKD